MAAWSKCVSVFLDIVLGEDEDEEEREDKNDHNEEERRE